MNKQDKEAFIEWYTKDYSKVLWDEFNGDEIVELAWLEACRHKESLADQIAMNEIIEKLEWAFHTINDKLKFGLSEEQAIIRREHRVRGVLRDVIKELKVRQPDSNQNSQTN